MTTTKENLANPGPVGLWLCIDNLVAQSDLLLKRVSA